MKALLRLSWKIANSSLDLDTKTRSPHIHSKPKPTHPQIEIYRLQHKMKALKKCSSKISLRKFLTKADSVLKSTMKFYLRNCFLKDLYTRKLENKFTLLSRRSLLFRIIEEPSILNSDCQFENNLLKNFCTGMSNFISANFERIKRLPLAEFLG